MTRWMLAAVAALAVAACDQPPSGNAASTQSNGSSPSAHAAATAADAATGGGGSLAATAHALTSPRFRDVTLASGTTLRLDLKTAVASDTSHVEDPVRATLRQPVVLDGQTVLPAGTELSGVVTGAERSGRVKGRARVTYRFDTLRVDGERYSIRTSPISHVAPATKRQDATKIGVGAGAGAVIGALVGGGSGAAKGAAIGGAGGTGVVLATRGREVRLGAGANVTTRLNEPLTVRLHTDE